MTTTKQIRLVVTESEVGNRLDKFLASIPEIATRTKAQYLLEKKLVSINGAQPKASLALKLGQEITIEIPQVSQNIGLVPLDLPIDIIYEDDDVIVVNKASGIVVHPAAGHEQDTLVNMLVAHTTQLSMKFNEMRPGIVHRIDKETSGLLVVAKNDSAHSHLTDQFKNRTIHRRYEALCMGNVSPIAGRVESVLGRHPTDRKRFSSQKSREGKIAITHYRVLKADHNLSFVELRLETGRTHQIRVHMSEKGNPLVGDNLYLYKSKLNLVKDQNINQQIRNLPRFMLHARDLGFVHPSTGKDLSFSVDWPEVDLNWLKELGFKK